MDENERLHLDEHLAAALGVAPDATRAQVAVALSRLSNLDTPQAPATRLVLSEIVAKIQSDVIDHPDIPMDRGDAAMTATNRGAISAGPEAVHKALVEWGRLALEEQVQLAIQDLIMPVLHRHGVIRLMSEPRDD